MFMGAAFSKMLKYSLVRKMFFDAKPFHSIGSSLLEEYILKEKVSFKIVGRLRIQNYYLITKDRVVG